MKNYRCLVRLLLLLPFFHALPGSNVHAASLAGGNVGAKAPVAGPVGAALPAYRPVSRRWAKVLGHWGEDFLGAPSLPRFSHGAGMHQALSSVASLSPAQREGWEPLVAALKAGGHTPRSFAKLSARKKADAVNAALFAVEAELGDSTRGLLADGGLAEARGPEAVRAWTARAANFLRRYRIYLNPHDFEVLESHHDARRAGLARAALRENETAIASVARGLSGDSAGDVRKDADAVTAARGMILGERLAVEAAFRIRSFSEASPASKQVALGELMPLIRSLLSDPAQGARQRRALAMILNALKAELEQAKDAHYRRSLMGEIAAIRHGHLFFSRESESLRALSGRLRALAVDDARYAETLGELERVASGSKESRAYAVDLLAAEAERLATREQESPAHWRADFKAQAMLYEAVKRLSQEVKAAPPRPAAAEEEGRAASRMGRRESISSRIGTVLIGAGLLTLAGGAAFLMITGILQIIAGSLASGFLYLVLSAAPLAVVIGLLKR